MIRTLFFDIGGVLVDLHPERTETLLQKQTGLDPDTLRDRFPLDVHHDYERGRLDDQTFFQRVKAKLGPEAHNLSPSAFWQAWMAMVGRPKRTAAWISVLRQEVPVWLLSNTNRYHVVHLLPDYPFYSQVDGAIFSYETGYRKPEAGIFHLALERAGVAPEEALFIDDVEANVTAARAVGLEAIHFHTPEQLAEELHRRGWNSFE
ncbi:MAG: HAD family phosphatase [Candidatus Neomarinimicrobiota bacterium]|nr:MAG: HAD family phosphatase [Candidatus Neomarinimicrobiota bacterium]